MHARCVVSILLLIKTTHHQSSSGATMNRNDIGDSNSDSSIVDLDALFDSNDSAFADSPSSRDSNDHDNLKYLTTRSCTEIPDGAYYICTPAKKSDISRTSSMNQDVVHHARRCLGSRPPTYDVVDTKKPTGPALRVRARSNVFARHIAYVAGPRVARPVKLKAFTLKKSPGSCTYTLECAACATLYYTGTVMHGSRGWEFQSRVASTGASRVEMAVDPVNLRPMMSKTRHMRTQRIQLYAQERYVHDHGPWHSHALVDRRWGVGALKLMLFESWEDVRLNRPMELNVTTSQLDLTPPRFVVPSSTS